MPTYNTLYFEGTEHVFKHLRDAARLLFHDARVRSSAQKINEKNGRAAFAPGFVVLKDLWLRDKNDDQYWRGFSLSFRRNQSADTFWNSLQEKPTSVERLALEETGDVYEYKDDSVGCGIKTCMGACKDVNPLYFKEQQGNVSRRKHSAHLNVNPMYCNVHPYLQVLQYHLVVINMYHLCQDRSSSMWIF